MTKIGVVAYQMTRLDETNTLVPFSLLILPLTKDTATLYLEGTVVPLATP